MIYFIETYTWTKIPYNIVHKANEFRWKDLYTKSSLRLAYEWKEEWEIRETYIDFIDLLERYNNKARRILHNGE